MIKLIALVMLAAFSAAVPAATPTPYKGHGLMGVSGLEPTVLVERDRVRVWYTALDYLDAPHAPGGISYGTQAYPFINFRIAYMEMKAADFASAVSAGAALP